MQPKIPHLEVSRNIYTDRAFVGDDLPAVVAIGQRVASVVGIAQPLAEAIPTDYDVHAEQLLVRYLDPKLDRPKYCDTQATILSAEIMLEAVHTPPTISLGGTLLAHAVDGVEVAAQAPMLALQRRLSMSYEQPRDTIAAAEKLGVVDIKSAIEARARLETFREMLMTLAHLGACVETDKGSDITRAYLQQNAHDIPRVGEAIKRVTDDSEGLSNDRKLSLNLVGIARKAYEQSKDPNTHKSMVEGLSEALEGLYTRPEFNDSQFTYPQAFDFGPVAFRPPMSRNRLSVPVVPERLSIDPRIMVRAEVEVDGMYDFQTHTFTAAERGNGRSKIIFELERNSASSEHTEQVLGKVLDRQMREMAGRHLPPEAFANYARCKQEVGRITTKYWNLKPANVNVHRHPLEHA